MKIKLLFAIVVFPMLMAAQTPADNNLTTNDVAELKGKLQEHRSMLNQLEVKVIVMQKKLQGISSNLDAQIATNKQLEEQLKSNLNLQAQNERAVNLAIDEFAKKFEDQNKTVAGVKAALEKQWAQQIMYYGLAIILFVIILLLSVKYSTTKALKQQQKSWNEFNEYIIKR